MNEIVLSLSAALGLVEATVLSAPDDEDDDPDEDADVTAVLVLEGSLV